MPPTPRRPPAASGLTVTITIDASSTAGACSIAAGVVSFTAAGTCVVDANQAGNANYNAAPQVQQTVDGRQGLPDHHLHLDQSAVRATVGGATYTPTATVRLGPDRVAITSMPRRSGCLFDQRRR